MADTPEPIDNPATRKKIYTLYRDYFDMAEKKRRWNLRNDIPWDRVAVGCVPPAVADVVETFCTTELYLPDYLAKQLPQVRQSRGRAWMLASWGYEESKHSLALGDWLLKSGHRSEEQMQDLEDHVADNEWFLRYEGSRASIVYVMIQELATQLNYANLRKVASGRCPALDKVLELVSIDEAAHAQFFRSLVSIYLEDDREKTIEQLRIVFNTFYMPADKLLIDGPRRIAAIKEMGIFDEGLFFNNVYTPLMNRLGLTRNDLRAPRQKKTDRVS
jgi:acyl-[acyl-carrier-protein] desaturase